MGKEQVTRTSIKKPAPLPARIHVMEFLMTVKMTEVEKAGLKAFAKGKVWMRLSEWQELLEEYKKRKGV